MESMRGIVVVMGRIDSLNMGFENFDDFLCGIF